MERYDSEGRLVEWITNIGDGVKTISYAYDANGVMSTRTTVEANDLEKITTEEAWDPSSECKKSLTRKEDFKTGIAMTTMKTETFSGRTWSVTKMNAQCP